MTNETLRMQMLAGVITEGQYKVKLQENEMAAVGEKVEAAAEDKLEATVDKLSDEQKAQLSAELAKAGITANSRIEDVAGKLDESLFEGEGDTKQKVASVLSGVGGALMGSMLVPLIPLIVGHTTGTGFGGGLAITAGVAGALIALAKVLSGGKTQESLNESMIGGIVGIGAINQIPPRAKADYELAFEHFLGERYETKFENREQDPYTMKEGEGEVMVDSNMVKSYFDELISLADDMEYTPEMADELENLKNTIQGGKISVENALDLMQQTIDITGDEIDAVEALGQAVDFDSAIIDKAREISGLDEGKEMKEEEVKEALQNDDMIYDRMMDMDQEQLISSILSYAEQNPSVTLTDYLNDEFGYESEDELEEGKEVENNY